MSSTEANQNQEKSSYILVEQTLAIIKPDAIAKTDEIEEIILRHGFYILRVSECKRKICILGLLSSLGVMARKAL